MVNNIKLKIVTKSSATRIKKKYVRKIMKMTEKCVFMKFLLNSSPLILISWRMTNRNSEAPKRIYILSVLQIRFTAANTVFLAGHTQHISFAIDIVSNCTLAIIHESIRQGCLDHLINHPQIQTSKQIHQGLTSI